MTLEEKVAEFKSQLPSAIREYLNNRGISNDAIHYFELGYCSYGGFNWISIPIKDESGVVELIRLRRDPNDSANPDKYKVYKVKEIENKKKSSLFNAASLVNEKEVAVITEGEFDAMVLAANGITAVSYTTGAGSLPDNYINKFKHLKAVVVCPDNDIPGKDGAGSIGKKLYNKLLNLEVRAFYLPENIGKGGDITDYIIKLGNDPADIIRKSERFFPFNSITSRSLCAKTFNDDYWVIDNFLAVDGITILASQPKCYKTFLSLYLAKCLANGMPLFGKFKTKKSKVLIINEENSERSLWKRMNPLSMDGIEDVVLTNLQGIKLDGDKSDQMKDLKKFIVTEKFNVIILDPLISLHSSDENSSKDMRALFNHLRELIELGTSIIITHHLNKGTFGGPKAYRGSTDIAAFVSNGFTIEKKTRNGKFVLTNDLSRDDETLEPLYLEIFKENDLIDFRELSEEAMNSLKQNELHSAVLKIIEEEQSEDGKGFTLKQIKALLPEELSDKSEASLRACIKSMKSKVLPITGGKDNATHYIKAE